jgi:hypothetical protein
MRDAMKHKRTTKRFPVKRFVLHRERFGKNAFVRERAPDG